jgi:hypothetical protein
MFTNDIAIDYCGFISARLRSCRARNFRDERSPLSASGKQVPTSRRPFVAVVRDSAMEQAASGNFEP